MKFYNLLIDWYLSNQRDLPWRKTKQPYHIWLSEIMLQQTRVAQGLPYYLRFVEEFPSVFDLAEASEEKVLKLWQGLGYYSRARNLHFTAKYVANELNGKFPHTYKELKKLKGVGDYTASAIASICFNEPVAVVDGNVYRVLSRVFGVDTPINSTEGIKEFKNLAEEKLDKENASVYNQAIMEFGALHCKPKNPYCITCPFQAECVAFQQGKIEELPIKLKKTKVKTKHFNYLVVVSEGKTVIQQRRGNGIWKNLYQFPLIETEKEVSKTQFLKEENFLQLLSVPAEKVNLFNKKPIKHVLSHRKLMVKFWVMDLPEISSAFKTKEFEVIQQENIRLYPVPVLIEKFIEQFYFNK
ncbi:MULTISPECIES: A/G-specific adenine glycosylase [Mesonia]|uniref:Adenine DNA glycosylase n=1 Tax=Mesonia oceanica TaxID=2687242 RepID=A0AC61YBE5_9FLAO|nr:MULTISPECIES: A/G-specific adenine glycosylase [Mesonia]MAN28441.1 A/G-specific adenine glycosylase [Mesonia sp.]MAQ40137.1 A/G-specific adenine glycosylase [Mesonia sp.]MBJ98936.1 A/G-specific adenine glycosylase [Flavobacteriaceae bacterium]VVV01827.1 Adenine DNA glycosylase [Mesonia oceanica]|tara:strand:- start:27837 stop:28901 length:1065 start_codon:yes stop_codon:yes gene_type:complete